MLGVLVHQSEILDTVHRRRLHRGGGKMPRYLRLNQDKSIILFRYYFAPATILSLLSYTAMVKIAAVRSVFTTKNSPKCFCGRGSAPNFVWSLPRILVDWREGTPRPIPNPSSTPPSGLNFHRLFYRLDFRRFDCTLRPATHY